jgi:bifunctional enzyme CysN/CysC
MRAPTAPSDEERLSQKGPALRLLTCGATGDGKSTLIGRLVHEHNLKDAAPNLPLLPDGADAEREHGLSDVAYRNFTTDRRTFVVGDTPAYEQLTRNMPAGAPNVDVALLLVDVRRGLLDETRRHAMVANLLGTKHTVLVVNKMDLVGYDHDPFERLAASFTTFARELGFKDVTAIPISAREGDNVSVRSGRTPWYGGPSLLDCLEEVEVEDDRKGKPLRIPVQCVSRTHSDFNALAGTIASGSACVGNEIAVLPSGQVTKINAISRVGVEVDHADAGDAVIVTLADEFDVARGDMLAGARARPHVADQFAAHVAWMSQHNLLPGRSYLMKINCNTLPATITDLKYRLDINTLARIAAKTLALNEVGVCNLAVGRPIPFDNYAENRTTGAFILIDRYSNETVAAGMIDFALRRATNIHYQQLSVSKAARSEMMQHRPAVVWFTGLSGAGKSTIANRVEFLLHARGVHTVMLDGDNVRHALSKDLGFTEADRVENIRRIGEVAKLMTDAGLVVLCAFISPFRAERRMVRELLPPGEFIEIFVDTPIEQCMARDAKGLYRRALAGEIKNFTGVDQPYEVPESPDLHLLAGGEAPDALAERVIQHLLTSQIVN